DELRQQRLERARIRMVEGEHVERLAGEGLPAARLGVSRASREDEARHGGKGDGTAKEGAPTHVSHRGLLAHGVLGTSRNGVASSCASWDRGLLREPIVDAGERV